MTCFNTQPPEGGWRPEVTGGTGSIVSTHSRPKAAGRYRRRRSCRLPRFNTQPPEGGWAAKLRQANQFQCFNTQPPEGGWLTIFFIHYICNQVSTHSRPKAAGTPTKARKSAKSFQHTAARRRLDTRQNAFIISVGFQHTAARRRLGCLTRSAPSTKLFQHTAARRRLA